MSKENIRNAASILGLPSAGSFLAKDLTDEYQRFLGQLYVLPCGGVVLSDPYCFDINTVGIHDSVMEWRHSLTAVEKNRLLLLSVLSRPFDLSMVWPDEEPRFIDDPLVALFHRVENVSLAEGSSGIPFGLDELNERRRAFADPGMKKIIDSLFPRSSLATMSAEFIGAQPGNYSYSAWQVSSWSPDWAVVYAVSDAGMPDGYPFPWLIGFCHKDNLERNFIALLRSGSERFDVGFYGSFGRVSGTWRLASLALTWLEDPQPMWDVIDQLLALDEELLTSVLANEPDDPRAFLCRMASLIGDVEESGLGDDVELIDLFGRLGRNRTLLAAEQLVTDAKAAQQNLVSRMNIERAEKLSPFSEVVRRWIHAANGPQPVGGNAGIGWFIRKQHIREYLERYVLEHGKLPTGCHDLRETRSYGLTVGVIDFDVVAKQVAQGYGSGDQS